MVKIKLANRGVRKKPFYRIVVCDDRRKLTGKTLETIGYWNPQKDEKKIDKARLNFWLDRGAQLTKGLTKLI
jgi:small subunit ribosomal protein S16